MDSSVKQNEIADKLLKALRQLVDASGHVSPFGGDATVKNVRKAIKYMAAYENAERVIEEVERSLSDKETA